MERGTDWLPFLAVITVLVFWHNGLYASREQRSGAGRVVSSLLLVLVVTLAFAIGTGYHHTTFGLYATAFVLSIAVIGGLRASYEIVTRDVWRLAGVRGARYSSATTTGSSTFAVRSASGGAASTTTSSAR